MVQFEREIVQNMCMPTQKNKFNDNQNNLHVAMLEREIFPFTLN